VRLKYGVVVECIGAETDASGAVTRVRAAVVPDTKSGTPGADRVKVKGNITWVGADDAIAAEIRLYGHLFAAEHPDVGDDLKGSVDPHSKSVMHGFVEPALASAQPDDKFQFERHGYFVADRHDHAASRPVFNRIAPLRDTKAP